MRRGFSLDNLVLLSVKKGRLFSSRVLLIKFWWWQNNVTITKSWNQVNYFRFTFENLRKTQAIMKWDQYFEDLVDFEDLKWPKTCCKVVTCWCTQSKNLSCIYSFKIIHLWNYNIKVYNKLDDFKFSIKTRSIILSKLILKGFVMLNTSYYFICTLQ